MDAGGVSLEGLRGLIPDAVLFDLPQYSDLSNRFRIAHFLAQTGHESGGFRTVEENLSYSAGRLLTIFPKYFPDLETANEYAYRPKSIADRVYAGRLGNGVQSTGDGYRFRGRGFIQLTGRANYQSFADWIGVDVVTYPEYVASDYAVASAVFFFTRRKIWTIADLGEGQSTIDAVSKMVNGGYIGLADRAARLKEILKRI